MALLPILQDDEASPEARTMFDHSRKMFGRVANSIRVAAHTPKVAQVLFGFIVAASRREISGKLDLRTKTLVILKTSLLNGCRYCVGHNVTLGRTWGMTDEELAALESDYAASGLFSPAEVAAIAWAEHLTKLTYRQNPQAMVALKEHYDEAQIVELTMTSGFFNFWNRFNDGLQIDPEAKEVTELFKKSAQIDPDAYMDYMRACWWGEGTPGAVKPKSADPAAAAE